jgi:CubicO group peptidase (beta-lactamase class C family)
LLSLVLGGPAFARGEFLAVHGETSGSYQTWFDRAVSAGYRLVYVNGYDAGGQPRFAAVAVKDGRGFAWEARHDLTSDQYQATFNTLTRQGYRLTCVSGYLGGGAPRFAAVWVQDRRPLRWEARHNLTARQYQDQVDALQKRGLRPDVVTGYADGTGSYRFAALFVEAGESPWVARHDLTAEQYQKAFDEWCPKGYRPTGVSAYPTETGRRFAVAFVKGSTGWAARHGLSSADYQAEFDRQAKAGYRPLSVAGYTEGQAADPEAFDRAMRQYMKERSIPAGTLAVSRGGRLLLARGYGSADAAGRRPLRPEDPLRIASVTKPITAAAVHTLVREKKLSLDAKAFPLLGLRPPPGQRPDPRLNDITIRNLLDHQGGWDRDKAFDPMFRPLEVAAAFGKPGPAGPTDVIRYMMGQPLQFAPGSRTCYSNFGYCVLGRVIEKVTGQNYVTYVRQKLLAPLKIQSVELGRSLPEDRNPREPIYVDPGKDRNVLRPKSKEPVPAPDGTFYLEAMDAHGGLIASAVDLTRFLEAYWISGERRQGDGRSYAFFGSLPGTFTMAMERPNGVNVVTLFNQRTDPSGLGYDKISAVMREVADRLTGGEVRYAAVWVKND